MSFFNKILIIGKGTDIVKTFYYVFKNNQVTNISFREAWKNPKKIGNFDIIILSGFHYEICQLSKENFIKYIKKYLKFIYDIKNKSKIFYLISTDLSITSSVSRVAYFYYILNKKINLKKDINIISFHTLVGHEKNLVGKLKIHVFKILGIKFFYYKEMKKKIRKIYKYDNKLIKFYFINYPRSRMIDRILRLFIDLYFLKIFKN